jgi:hypothetical protein
MAIDISRIPPQIPTGANAISKKDGIIYGKNPLEDSFTGIVTGPNYNGFSDAAYFFNYAKLDLNDFNADYGYGFQIEQNGSTVQIEKIPAIYTFPINPSAISIQTPTATLTEVTMKGIVETHNGAPLRKISISGTTGVWPILKSSSSTNSSDFPILEYAFKNTIKAAGNTVNQFKKFAAFEEGGPQQNLYNSPLTRKFTANAEVLKSTGFATVHDLKRFLDFYISAKKESKNNKWRLTFWMKKDREKYYCTLNSYSIQKVAGSLEYNYSIELTAWRRAPLTGDIFVKPRLSSVTTDKNKLSNIIAGISQARRAISSSLQILSGIRSDIKQTFINPIGEVLLLMKDIAGVALSVGDFKESIIKDLSDPIGKYINQNSSILDKYVKNNPKAKPIGTRLSYSTETIAELEADKTNSVSITIPNSIVESLTPTFKWSAIGAFNFFYVEISKNIQFNSYWRKKTTTGFFATYKGTINGWENINESEIPDNQLEDNGVYYLRIKGYYNSGLKEKITNPILFTVKIPKAKTKTGESIPSDNGKTDEANAQASANQSAEAEESNKPTNVPKESKEQETADPLSKIFDDPTANAALLEEINIDELPLTDEQRASITKAIEAAKDKTTEDLINLIKQSSNFAAYISAALGGASKTYNRVNLVSTPLVKKKLSTNDIELLSYFNNIIMQLNSFVQLMDSANSEYKEDYYTYYKDLATNEGLTFSGEYTSKIYVPFPYNATLEQLATQYLGDPEKWIEIAALNQLKAPYVDEEGKKVKILASFSGDTISIPSGEKLYVGQIVKIGSNTSTISIRKIKSIDIINTAQTFITFEAGNFTPITSYKPSDNAYIRIYQPHTVNSDMIIAMPSNLPPDQEPIYKITPELKDLNNLAKIAKIDFLLNSEGDLILTGGGDIKYAAGLTNIVQAATMILKTNSNSLLQDPNFGIPDLIGQNTSEVKAQSIADSINESFKNDPRFAGLVAVEIQKSGPAITINSLLNITNTDIRLPISAELPRITVTSKKNKT